MMWLRRAAGELLAGVQRQAALGTRPLPMSAAAAAGTSWLQQARVHGDSGQEDFLRQASGIAALAACTGRTLGLPAQLGSCPLHRRHQQNAHSPARTLPCLPAAAAAALQRGHEAAGGSGV